MLMHCIWKYLFISDLLFKYFYLFHCTWNYLRSILVCRWQSPTVPTKEFSPSALTFQEMTGEWGVGRLKPCMHLQDPNYLYKTLKFLHPGASRIHKLESHCVRLFKDVYIPPQDTPAPGLWPTHPYIGLWTQNQPALPSSCKKMSQRPEQWSMEI